MSEEHKNCKYRFKGKSCEDCPLNCKFKRLQEENEKLKIYIESNKQQVEEVETLVMDNDRLQQETENLKDIIYYDVEKYKQALEEIRDIAKKATNSKDCYVYMYAGRMYCEPILKKINEVLNDRY